VTEAKMTRPTPVFYVFHGEDEFSISETLDDFKGRLGPPDMVELNTTVLDARSLTLAELRHACDAVPFLADKRLVIVHGLLTRLADRAEEGLSKAKKRYLAALADYLPALPETTRLVFVEPEKLPARHPILKLAQREAAGYVKRFDPPRPKHLPRWIAERVHRYGGEIEPYAARSLGDVAGHNLRLLDQELAKLVTYTKAERSITAADVNTLVPYVQEAIIFDLVDALGRRDGAVAARTLHRLLEEGDEKYFPLRILAMIARQFRLLIQITELQSLGATQSDIIKTLKLHPFPAGKLRSQATHFTAAQLETVYRHILDTDVAIKSGEMDADLALDLLVAGLAATD
jgi:DNA polymerase-3 subunit delta